MLQNWFVIVGQMRNRANEAVQQEQAKLKDPLFPCLLRLPAPERFYKIIINIQSNRDNIYTDQHLISP